jgi:hypothetical protein
MDTPEVEIRKQLARYLRSETSLDEFAEWFVPEALYLDEQAHEHPISADLAAHIDLLLIECFDGRLAEEELRGALAPFAFEPPSNGYALITSEPPFHLYAAPTAHTGASCHAIPVRSASAAVAHRIDARFVEAAA